MNQDNVVLHTAMPVFEQDQLERVLSEKNTTASKNSSCTNKLGQYGLIVVSCLLIGAAIVTTALLVDRQQHCCGNGGAKNTADLRPTNDNDNTNQQQSSSSRTQAILDSINAVTLTGRTLIYPDATTPEGRAIMWLIDDDLLTPATFIASLSPTATAALVQRYAVATVWFQTTHQTTTTAPGDSAAMSSTPYGYDTSMTWTKNLPECDWLDVDCDAMGNIVHLDWAVVDHGDGGGHIPDDLGLLTALTGLSILGSRGTMTGHIPSSLGRLTALQMLHLYSNDLTGTIPTSLTALTALTSLQLDRNQLMGTIPASWGTSLLQLRDLYLSDNALTGTIPTTLVALTSLTRALFYHNQLVGTVPFCNGGGNVAHLYFMPLIADCDEVKCPCCTHCCPSGGWDDIQGYDYCS
jgi:hypothetical protein